MAARNERPTGASEQTSEAFAVPSSVIGEPYEIGATEHNCTYTRTYVMHSLIFPQQFVSFDSE